MNLELIRILGKKRKGGLRKLSADIGMSETNFHRCISDNRMECSDLELVARCLGVGVADFFDPDVRGASMSHVGDGGVQAVKIGRVSVGSTLSGLKRENELLHSLLKEKDARLAEKDALISYLMDRGDETDKA